MKKIYISGPITGNENWKESFYRIQAKLIEKNFIVISPLVIAEELEKEIKNPTYEDYMRSDIRMLCVCDAIIFLNGWEKSKGATCEKNVADCIGLEEYFESDFF